MSWYYARDNEQKGPVSDDEFAALRQNGSITGETLVWREGMTHWQACAEVFREGDAAQPPLPSLKMAAAPGMVCSGCGRTFPMDEVIRMGNGFVCAACKQTAIQRMREGVGPSEAEEIRTEHIKHEASVKAVGFLYLLGGCLVFLGSLGILVTGVMAANRQGQTGELAAVIGMGVGMSLFGVLQFSTGLGLRRFRPWSRVVAALFSGLGLLGFPFGTIINGYILYLLLSARGKMVFSAEYQEIIEQTPEIKYRTSIIVWIVLAIVVLLVVMFMVTTVVRVGR
jgi:predicted nucleic acid-binding Zn ribbon protein